MEFLRTQEKVLSGTAQGDLKQTYGQRLRTAGVSFDDRQDVIGELKVVKSGRFETRRLFGLVLIVSFDRLVLPGVFPSYNKWLRGG